MLNLIIKIANYLKNKYLINLESHFKTLIMKNIFLTTFGFVSLLSFQGNTQNQSAGAVNTFPIIGSSINDPLLPDGIFRFRSGAVTQLDGLTTNYTFNPTDTWFSLGRVNAGSQSFYGSRFQNNGKALVMGFSTPTATTNTGNARIEWIGATAASAGNLEFRSGIGFGAAGSPGTTTLVASMTPEGNTYFGTTIPSTFTSNNPKVGIAFDNAIGFQINTLGILPSSINPTGALINVLHSGNEGAGLRSNCGGGESSIGLFGRANGLQSSIGVFGATSTVTAFSAAIYGDAQISGGNLYAGYFNGDIMTTAGFFAPSDAKLKENIANEKSMLVQISKLRPVSYVYKNIDGINLAKGNQHGFISQEMAEVFPELTKDVSQPTFDEDGKVISEISYKAINYVGLISVLTSGIQELNTQLQAVRQELNEYKANDNVRSQLMQNNTSNKGYSLEQNSPNPFSDRSVIRYKLVDDNSQATISIFNLNGGFVKEYALDGNAGEITVLASEIGKGMFIYSLTVNGQEMISKRMIVK